MIISKCVLFLPRKHKGRFGLQFDGLRIVCQGRRFLSNAVLKKVLLVSLGDGGSSIFGEVIHFD